MNIKLPRISLLHTCQSAFILLLLFYSTSAKSQCCTYTLSMHDSYGDGWNGGHLEVFINNLSIGTFSATNLGRIDTFQICNDDQVDLYYTAGDYENENTYQLYDSVWNLVFADGPNPQPGTVFSSTCNCLGSLVPGSNPCNALPIDTGQCLDADNTGFQGSGINPNCANNQGADCWFTMQVPPSGNLSFETDSGTITDTGLAVWTDSTCTNLRLLGCDDDGGNNYFSFLTLYDLIPNETIYIQIWGYGGGTGSFQLCVNDLGTVVLDSTELPIVMINTLGQTIVPETKIDCLMDIKFNGPNTITYVSDPANIYSGNIGIEIRGATSASYPQPPYGIETRDENGANNNVSILGMPPENDWVLLSNFNDRSLIRNTLAFKLFGDMGNYSPRTSLCEVLIDSSYKGIYVLGEKIKRDANRVDIANLTLADTTGDDLTGGYILQQNYWDAGNSFQSNYSPIDHPGFDVHFVYEYPDPETILPAQKAYIAAYVDSLETALYSPDFADPVSGYRKYMDVKSFIDYFLVNELSRNGDGFKKSVFFYKDKYSNGGKLKAGPIWDFDWAWKNLYGCSIFETFDGSGWAHHINDCPTDNYSTGWYIRLLQDTTFNNELRCTYENYRQTILDTANLFAYIDSIKNLVQNAQARHFQKWPILGMSGPAPEIGAIATTYNAELDTLKNWITVRLQWLDQNIPGLCIPLSVEADRSTASDVFRFFPNPANNFVQINYSVSSPANVTICMMNYLGAEVTVFNQGIQCPGNYCLKLETANLPPGIYFIRFQKGSIATTGKLVIVK
jgi:hypothetical protein